jgi:nitrogen-specific signal transduction histidine kinase
VLLELVDEERSADPAWRERAFDVYASLEGVAIRGENGGLTLGLALAERILRLHGGELAVAAGEDEPVFTVVLPLDRAADEG